MRRSLLRRALLGVVLGLGVSADELSRAHGQEVLPGRPVMMPNGAVPSGPAAPGRMPYADQASPPSLPPVVVETSPPVEGYVYPAEGPSGEGAPAPEKHRLVSLLRPRNLAEAWHKHFCCYAHHNDYSCGNLHAEWIFHFGSCRQFYGERCLKGPPQGPVPGYDPRTGTYSPPDPTGSFAPVAPAGCSCR